MKTSDLEKGVEGWWWEQSILPELFGRNAGMKFSGISHFGETASMEREYVPDASKGYARFSLAHAFPVLCQRGCFHAATVANSWRSMLHQGFNYDHRVKSYHESGTSIEDRYIGAVLSLDYPRTPVGGWKMTSLQESPGLTCVASVFKGAQGVGKIIGEHQTGRHEWTVSLEMNHSIEEAGVVVMSLGEGERWKDGSKEKALTAGEDSLFEEWTPGDFKAAGVRYVPLAKAPEEFIDCWDMEAKMFARPWKGRRLSLMFGGLNGEIHFKGVGLVKYGAEPTAKLEQVLAARAATEEEAAVEAAAAAIRAMGAFEIR